MRTKYYAVKNGRKTGIFDTWEEAKAQVDGYNGTEFKSFKNMEDAEAYMGCASGSRKDGSLGYEKEDGVMAAYVDGSYSDAIPAFSYGLVALIGGKAICECRLDTDKDLISMRNVAGEIKGAEAAMALAMRMGCPKLHIYHDYEGIAKWCLGAWQANKEGTKAYKAYYDSVRGRLDITFHKVAGHSGDRYNDMADRLAKAAIGII